MATETRTSKGHGASERRPAVTLIEAVEVVVRLTERAVSKALGGLQVRLEVWRLKLDPSTTQWVAETRRSMADGSFEERVRNQPSPAEIVEQALKARREV